MKISISIIGSGPAAMMLACSLDENKFDITIYEKNKALGRKFLVAGDGGFNLTHSEDTVEFVKKYIPPAFFENIISAFTNADLQQWLKSIGIETFVGSSKRVFPIKGIKPIDVLNSILNLLKRKKISIKTQHSWVGWDEKDELLFKIKDKIITVKSDITAFALGGASWKITGSDGNWINHFSEKGIKVLPFLPSNCSVKINWSKDFIKLAEGETLKNISVTCGEKQQKGEVVITNEGIEGSAIYAMSSVIRKQLNEQNKATIFIDLKPAFTLEEIKNKLNNRGNKSITQVLGSVLNINRLQVSLIKSIVSKDEFISGEVLAEKIKKLSITINGLAPIDEAISTVGGISLTEIDNYFEIKKLSNQYAIGEMLDWDAPTGGYLLQGCFSMGFYLANHLNKNY